jgi:hypothetical protein
LVGRSALDAVVETLWSPLKLADTITAVTVGATAISTTTYYCSSHYGTALFLTELWQLFEKQK